MDPLEQAKQKMANGQPLTREEATVISNAGVTSSDIAALKQPAAPTKPSPTQIGGYSMGPTKKPPLVKPQGNVIPTPQNPENVALSQTIQKSVGDAPETYDQWIARTGKAMSPSSAKEYNANLKSLVPQSPPPPVAAAPIPSVPIQPVTSTPKATPPPVVSSTIKNASPADAHLLDTPISTNDAKGAVNAMDQFLKANPDGATLANILDVVGVALSARGGVQRQTMLAKRKEAEMQYAQGLGQAQAIKAMDLDNQSKIIQMQLQSAIAQNNQQAAVELSNKLKEIEAQKNANIEQTKAISGVNGLSGAGGIPGLVNKYAGVGQ